MSADHDPTAASDRPQLPDLLLSLVPADGSTIGNTALRRLIESQLTAGGRPFSDDAYWQAQAELIAQGLLLKGQGRGGTLRRRGSGLGSVASGQGSADAFALQTQEPPSAAELPKKAKRNSAAATAKPKSRPAADEATQVISYRHLDKRKNNPEVGMVTPATDPEAGKTRWAFDPHLDPALAFDCRRAGIEALIDDALATGDPEQMRAALEELKRLQSPYLNWAGKAERTSFEIDTVSLHVHERIDAMSILSAVRKAFSVSSFEFSVSGLEFSVSSFEFSEKTSASSPQPSASELKTQNSKQKLPKPNNQSNSASSTHPSRISRCATPSTSIATSAAGPTA